VRKLSAWQHGKVPVEDILGMGNEALFMAGRSWKPTNNSGFATYAKPYILRSVLRDLNNTSNMIRLPVNIMLDIKKLKYTERNLTQTLGREPKKSEIAKALGIKEKRIDELQAHIMREPMGLNDPKKEDNFEENHDD
jgi:DNA-directed RNA polymerase sigma subunit (sigma70/sigma32)